MRQQVGPQADLKRPRVIPDLAEPRADEQRQGGGQRGLQGAAARCWLAPQPAGHERQRRQPDQVFRKKHRQPERRGGWVGWGIEPEKQGVIE